jgi:hypothetical protein
MTVSSLFKALSLPLSLNIFLSLHLFIRLFLFCIENLDTDPLSFHLYLSSKLSSKRRRLGRISAEFTCTRPRTYACTGTSDYFYILRSLSLCFHNLVDFYFRIDFYPNNDPSFHRLAVYGEVAQMHMPHSLNSGLTF